MDLTVPQAAQRTKVAEETIRRWIRSGKLPARKVGTQHIISDDDLDLVVPKRRRSRPVAESTQAYATTSADIDPTLLARVVVNPKVAFGKPVIKGTRIAVELVLGFKGSGWSDGDILSGFPHLQEEDVRACFAYAAARVAEERVWLLR